MFHLILLSIVELRFQSPCWWLCFRDKSTKSPLYSRIRDKLTVKKYASELLRFIRLLLILCILIFLKITCTQLHGNTNYLPTNVDFRISTLGYIRADACIVFCDVDPYGRAKSEKIIFRELKRFFFSEKEKNNTSTNIIIPGTRKLDILKIIITSNIITLDQIKQNISDSTPDCSMAQVS